MKYIFNVNLICIDVADTNYSNLKILYNTSIFNKNKTNKKIWWMKNMCVDEGN